MSRAMKNERTLPPRPSEKETLRRRLLELIVKNEERRRRSVSAAR